MPRSFLVKDRTLTTATLAESRRRGRAKTLSWTNPWFPGGPHVFTEDLGDTTGWNAYAAATVANRDAFIEGFRDGLDANNQN